MVFGLYLIDVVGYDHLSCQVESNRERFITVEINSLNEKDRFSGLIDCLLVDNDGSHQPYIYIESDKTTYKKQLGTTYVYGMNSVRF